MIVPDALERFRGFIELVIQLGENNGNPIALIYLLLGLLFVLGLRMNSSINAIRKEQSATNDRLDEHEKHCGERHRQIEARFAEIEGGK